MDVDVMRHIASQELKITVRSKWTLIFALVFGVLALGIATVGLTTAGYAGFQSFTRTSASLLNLVLYIVPLMALLMGTLSFTSEKAANDLLFAQPISRSEILLGKTLGLFGSILVSTLIGFGLAGVIIAVNVGANGSLRYLMFVGLALGLGLAFLSLAILAAIAAHRRASAFGLALFLWFFFVIFYDLLVIGVTFLMKPTMANAFTLFSLFGNPVDIVRVAGLILLGGREMFGPAGALLVRTLGGTTGVMILVMAMIGLWIIIPLIIANRLLWKQDI